MTNPKVVFQRAYQGVQFRIVAGKDNNSGKARLEIERRDLDAMGKESWSPFSSVYHYSASTLYEISNDRGTQIAASFLVDLIAEYQELKYRLERP